MEGMTYLSPNATNLPSNDGGKTCHAENNKVNGIMTEIGGILNLKPHMVCGKLLAFAGDIEVHKGHVRIDYIHTLTIFRTNNSIVLTLEELCHRSILSGTLSFSVSLIPVGEEGRVIQSSTIYYGLPS